MKMKPKKKKADSEKAVPDLTEEDKENLDADGYRDIIRVGVRIQFFNIRLILLTLKNVYVVHYLYDK